MRPLADDSSTPLTDLRDLSPSRSAEWAERTVADFSTILLEFARAARGFLFNDETDRPPAPGR
jgi:hypothetical protein